MDISTACEIRFYDIFVKFHKFVCTQFSSKVKIFQSDGGTEFVNHRLRHFFDMHGIQHRISCPYTPQQNGRGERKHMHISESGLSMLFHAHAPASFWFDAFATAVHVINRLPYFVLDHQSPYEVLFGCAPNYANFKPFGCRVFPYLRDYSPHKLAPRSRPCIFLGYSSSHEGFRCHDPATSHTFITRHAQSDALCFPFSATPSTTIVSHSSDVTTYEDPLGLVMPTPSPKASSSSSTMTSPCQPCSMLQPDSVVSMPAPSIPEPVPPPQ